MRSANTKNHIGEWDLLDFPGFVFVDLFKFGVSHVFQDNSTFVAPFTCLPARMEGRVPASGEPCTRSANHGQEGFTWGDGHRHESPDSMLRRPLDARGYPDCCGGFRVSDANPDSASSPHDRLLRLVRQDRPLAGSNSTPGPRDVRDQRLILSVHRADRPLTGRSLARKLLRDNILPRTVRAVHASVMLKAG